MQHEYDQFSVTEMDEGVLLRLPDGSSVEVPQDTIRRSIMLQEAIHACDTAADASISLPQGVLQDWLQSVYALEAAATSQGHGTDIARNTHLLRFVRVRFFSLHGLKQFFVRGNSCGWQYSCFSCCSGRVVPQ